MEQNSFEQLGGGVRLCVSPAHKFGTDAFLLSAFAAPRRKDICCDLGAGCGIVGALWLRDERTAPQKIFAVELQAQAVAQMQTSITAGGLPHERFVPIHADLRELAGEIPAGSVDLVTCNPPYKIAGTGILSASEADRVARHETMCGMDDVCTAAARLLRFGGRLCVCQRPERLADVLEAMRKSGIEPKRLRFVQQQEGGVPWLFLAEGKRGAKPFLQVERPLIIEGPGGFSAELLAIYGKEHNR